jgi:Mlc titration factor MtfA (ptsG expression regulator)
VLRWLTEHRRAHLVAQPFPPEWVAILERNVAAYALLDATERKQLRELVQVFVAEKHWEGCGGLELTDEIRVTIAGSGCQLLLGGDHDLFSDVHSILVYPSTIRLPEEPPRLTSSPIVGTRGGDLVLGLTRKHDEVVLAWDSALGGARDAHDGHNVVIHELAHKIDYLNGAADGTPSLPDGAARRALASAFEPAFLAQRERAARGEKSLLDDYAITNEAEYFAVATEVFFEKPHALARELPDVYAQLSAFYRLDLAARHAAV